MNSRFSDFLYYHDGGHVDKPWGIIKHGMSNSPLEVVDLKSPINILYNTKITLDYNKLKNQGISTHDFISRDSQVRIAESFSNDLSLEIEKYVKSGKVGEVILKSPIVIYTETDKFRNIGISQLKDKAISFDPISDRIFLNLKDGSRINLMGNNHMIDIMVPFKFRKNGIILVGRNNTIMRTSNHGEFFDSPIGEIDSFLELIKFTRDKFKSYVAAIEKGNSTIYFNDFKGSRLRCGCDSYSELVQKPMSFSIDECRFIFYLNENRETIINDGKSVRQEDLTTDEWGVGNNNMPSFIQ